MGEVTELIEKQWKNHEFLEGHYKELQKKYPNQYVVVLDSKLVGHGKNAKTLLNRIRKQFSDVRTLVYEFIPEKGTTVIY